MKRLICLMLLTLFGAVLVLAQVPDSVEWKPVLTSAGGFISTLTLAPNGDILAGTHAGGIYRSKDKGETWETLRIPRFGGLPIVELDVAHNGFIFATRTIYDPLLRSTDDGQTWDIFGHASGVRGIDGLDFSEQDTLYLWGGLLTGTSSDYGDTFSWVEVDTSRFVVVLDVERLPDSLWYAGATFSTFLDNPPGGLYRSLDAGQTWELIFDFFAIDEVVVTQRGDIYGYSQGWGLGKSTDGGQTFVPENLIEEGNEGKIYQDLLGTLYVPQSRRIRLNGRTEFVFDLFISHDDGDRWRSLHFDAVPPDSTGYQNRARYIVADQEGFVYVADQWVYRTTEPVVTTTTEVSVIPPSLALDAYPNPFNAVTTIQLVLNHPESVEILVYDLLGRPIIRLHEGMLPGGMHRFALDQLPASGIYLCVVQTKQGRESKVLHYIQ